MNEFVAVLGSGTMGRAIAIALARGGLNVLLYARQVRPEIARLLQREDALDQRLTGQRDPALPKIELIDDLAKVNQADIVIESISEDLASKFDLLTSVSLIASPSAVFFSNTSSIDLDLLEQPLRPSGRCLTGLHFFNPATRLKIVEITPSRCGDQIPVELAKQLAERIGYRAVVVPDVPGAVVNRLLFLMIAEAIRLVESGMSPKELDDTMKVAANHAMGPLELADFIGLDVCERILENLYQRTQNPIYVVPGLLKAMLRDGKLGKKSGAGFYDYGRRPK